MARMAYEFAQRRTGEVWPAAPGHSGKNSRCAGKGVVAVRSLLMGHRGDSGNVGCRGAVGLVHPDEEKVGQI